MRDSLGHFFFLGLELVDPLEYFFLLGTVHAGLGFLAQVVYQSESHPKRVEAVLEGGFIEGCELNNQIQSDCAERPDKAACHDLLHRMVVQVDSRPKQEWSKPKVDSADSVC